MERAGKFHVDAAIRILDAALRLCQLAQSAAIGAHSEDLFAVVGFIPRGSRVDSKITDPVLRSTRLLSKMIVQPGERWS